MFVGDDRKRNFKWELKSDSWCNTSQKHGMSKKPFFPGLYVSDAIKATLFSPIFFSFLQNFMTLVVIFYSILSILYLCSAWQKSGILCNIQKVNETDDFADDAPLCSAPCMLTMLVSSRSGCEESRPVGEAFPTGRLRVSGIVASPHPAAPPPPTRAWLMWPCIVFQEDHWDHWVACCFKG